MFIIFIRVNQGMFSGSSNINVYASGKRIVSVKLPSVSSVEGDAGQDSNSNEADLNSIEPIDYSGFSASNQQIPDLVTLSLLPKSQWQSLINLDVIKVTTFSTH